MAVPFNIPEENNEVDVIINQLQSLLTQLQVVVRQNNGNISNIGSAIPPLTPRVRNNPGSQRHSNEENPIQTNQSESSTPEPFNNLAWLTSISQENINLSSQLTMIPFARSRSQRNRTLSDSCDETKINITTTIVNADSIQDWTQIGVALRKLADDFSSIRTQEEDLLSPPTTKGGILSKLPGTLTGSIWTAMLCCVGWHLFRAR